MLRQLVCPLSQLATGQATEPVTDVLARMRPGCGEGRALIFDGRHLVGVISPEDVARALHWARLTPEHTTA